jgi:hypothetical protein
MTYPDWQEPVRLLEMSVGPLSRSSAHSPTGSALSSRATNRTMSSV